MAEDLGSTFATRGDQMFLRFSDDELARLAKFGDRRTYKRGELLARRGEVGPGLVLIFSGKVEATQPNAGESTHIVTHERGNFMGELAQLSGRPSLVDAALTDVEAIAISAAVCARC